MVIKVYVAMISCSQEIKKNQQRAVMILESKNIPYTVIDITDPGNEEAKDYMMSSAVPKPETKIPVTPQIFNEADYCGDYDGLDMANECDTLGDFLKLSDDEKSTIRIGITGIVKKSEEEEHNKMTNGVSANASREGSAEKTEAVQDEPATEEPAAPEEKDKEETPVETKEEPKQTEEPEQTEEPKQTEEPEKKEPSTDNPEEDVKEDSEERIETAEEEKEERIEAADEEKDSPPEEKTPDDNAPREEEPEA